jgi:putative flavoprotein involved in K+ transport
MPTIAGQDEFRGQVFHSSNHQGGAAVKGKRVVVLGGGSSAHDIAQDAYESHAKSVTMVQRSRTYILSQRNGVPIFHGTYYSENSPRVHEADLLASSMPMALVSKTIPVATRMIADADQEMIDRLHDIGFETWLGKGDAGMMDLGLVRGGGYYIDKGCAQLLIDGKIDFRRGTIDHFTPTGVVYSDGTEQEADIVVFSTGYTNMREATRPVVGDAVADQLGLVWGIDETGEQRTTLRHSGHEKLWIMANGFQQARIHSKHVALMIKAMDEGLLDPKINVEKKTTAMHP